MPAPDHAVFKELDGRSALRFERVLAHPPERVWSALTSHAASCSAGTPRRSSLEPIAGRRVSYYRAAPEAPEMPDGTVLAYEPPRLLAYTWGEDELRWELRAHDEGCAAEPHALLR